MSFGEILVILLVALIVLGPKRLPEIAYWLGRTMRLIQHARRNLQQVWDEQVKLAELEHNKARAKIAESQPTNPQLDSKPAAIKTDASHED